MNTKVLFMVLSVLVYFATAQPTFSGQDDGEVHRNHQLSSIQRKILHGATDFSLNALYLKHLHEFLLSEVMKKGKEKEDLKNKIIEKPKKIIRKMKTARICKSKVCTMIL